MLDIKAGEVCRLKFKEGLWVPITPGAGRSDGSKTRYHCWRFVSYPTGENGVYANLDDVTEIVHPIGSKESVDFWRWLTEQQEQTFKARCYYCDELVPTDRMKPRLLVDPKTKERAMTRICQPCHDARS